MSLLLLARRTPSALSCRPACAPRVPLAVRPRPQLLHTRPQLPLSDRSAAQQLVGAMSSRSNTGAFSSSSARLGNGHVGRGSMFGSSARQLCTSMSDASSSTGAPEAPPFASRIGSAGDDPSPGLEPEAGDGSDDAEPEFPLLLSHMRPKGDTSRKYIKLDELGRAYATGRRKTAVARVWVWDAASEGSIPSIKINKKSVADFCGGHWMHRYTILAPFFTTGTAGKYAVMATAKGGGITGQAEAIRLGIATAMQGLDPSLRPILKKAGYLTRDHRRAERKKPGQKGARKKFAWVKR